MTRQVTRLHIFCDADKCPEWISFTAPKNIDEHLPASWLAVGNNLHFCPQCRADARTKDKIEQPPPKPGRSLVGPTTRKMFAKVLAEQEGKGLKKYGTRLETFNGRSPILDAMAEVVDAFQYLSQAYMEQQQECQ